MQQSCVLKYKRGTHFEKSYLEIEWWKIVLTQDTDSIELTDWLTNWFWRFRLIKQITFRSNTDSVACAYAFDFDDKNNQTDNRSISF